MTGLCHQVSDGPYRCFIFLQNSHEHLSYRIIYLLFTVLIISSPSIRKKNVRWQVFLLFFFFFEIGLEAVLQLKDDTLNSWPSDMNHHTQFRGCWGAEDSMKVRQAFHSAKSPVPPRDRFLIVFIQCWAWHTAGSQWIRVDWKERGGAESWQIARPKEEYRKDVFLTGDTSLLVVLSKHGGPCLLQSQLEAGGSGAQGQPPLHLV